MCFYKKQWMWVLWHVSYTAGVCNPFMHSENCRVIDPKRFTLLKIVFLLLLFLFLIIYLKWTHLLSDTPLSHHITRALAREEWSQRPLVLNVQPSSPPHYNRRSSTPLHNSKIRPFTSIDYIPCSVLWCSLLSTLPCSTCTLLCNAEFQNFTKVLYLLFFQCHSIQEHICCGM